MLGPWHGAGVQECMAGGTAASSVPRPSLSCSVPSRLSPARLPGVAQPQPNLASADPVGSFETTWGPCDSHPEAADHLGAGPGSSRSSRYTNIVPLLQ